MTAKPDTKPSQPTVRSINFDARILAALDRKAEQTGNSRSSMVNYALAQLLSIPFELKKGNPDD